MSDFENGFKTLFQSMELGAYLQGADGSMVDVNRAALTMLGMTREKFLASCGTQPCWRLTGESGEELSPDQHPATIALRSADEVRDFVAAVHLEGKPAPIWVNLNAIPLRDETGAADAVMVTMKDISQLRRLEQAAAAATAEREREHQQLQLHHVQKLESLGVLAGGIAHDFNNILTSILGNTELALMQLTPGAPACENLHRVERASHRAAALLKQMLFYLGKGPFSSETIDLNLLVEEMADMLQAAISKKATLRLELSRPLGLFAADPVQMRQVVMNLVLNASESLRNEVGKIKISTAKRHFQQEELAEFRGCDGLAPGPYISLSVSDTGYGMDKETRARFFERLFPATGRGLGMAAVMGVIRGLRGGVHLQSEVGKGSTFTLILPVDDEAVASVKPKEAADEPMGMGPVLLVDDEEEVCQLVGAMLERLGYEVITARDGHSALSLYLQRDDYAFVILDLTMPVMDGEETYDQLRSIDPSVKVFITSGYNEKEVTRRFEGKGVKGVLQKPFDMDALRKVVG
jgi:PAS domain S-box-containing protein